jgi:hypothetical protein
MQVDYPLAIDLYLSDIHLSHPLFAAVYENSFWVSVFSFFVEMVYLAYASLFYYIII